MIRALNEAFLRAPLAHRALHDVTDGRPENSIAAVRAAIDRGYGIEIDVQCSSDNHAVVFHDYELDRLAHASGLVHAQTAQSLSSIPLRGGNERIPTLIDVLEEVDGRVPLLVEIKDQDGAMGANVGPLETATAKALAGYKGPLALMSFNPHSVACLAELCPEIPRGLVTSGFKSGDWDLPRNTRDRLREIPDYDRVAASFISHDVTDLDRPRVAELKQLGANVLCWTVRSPAQEARARKVAENVTFEGYLAQVAG